IYTDGACERNGSQNASAGAGVYWGERCPRNCALRVPGPGQTNNRGELYAVLEAVRQAEPYKTLRIFTDSKYVADSLVWLAPKNMAHGWDCANGDLLREFATLMRVRSARVFIARVKGHSGDVHNDAADALAKQGA
ncbi:ribonuclease H-like protein, partial [Auricularia subglabra TFB-10046 SS5]